jgi:MFS transporter, DHA1 family, inner membrane transport protein
MAFFGNDAVNRVNLHYGVLAFATGAGGVFFFAILLHAGIPVPAALASFAAIIAGRFVLRPLILPLGKRWGLRPMVIAGALLTALDYVMLGEVRGLGPWLAAYCVTSSVASTLYWPSYHAYFAALGDAEHRGHQIGAREALAAIVGVVAPLIGAWGLVTAGPRWTFWAVAGVQVLSAVPLFFAPDVPVLASAPGAFKAARRGMALFITDGWMGGTLYYVWQAVLFISLGRNIAAYGGAVALAALVGAVIGLVFGRHIDRGHGQRAVIVAYAVTAGVILVRAGSLSSPWLAIIGNASGAFVAALAGPALMTAVYNLAKASPCPLRFHIATEGAWDVGCGSGALTAAALAAAGVSLAVAILLALPAAALCAWLLWRYYGANPAAAEVEIALPLFAEPPAPP